MYATKTERAYRGLGQAASGLATIRGVATYHTGAETIVRRRIHDTKMSVCEARAATNPSTVCVPTRDKVDSAGNVIPWAIEYQDELQTDQRLDGSAGWQLYVPDLIPTTGGYLAGGALLEGDLPALVAGQTYTLQGEWVGTRPNNLCVNCGWPFRVVAEAAAGAEVETGAIDQDSDEMVLVRLRAISETQDDPEAGAIADDLERGEITVEQAVEKDAQLQLDRQAAAESPPASNGTPDEGTPDGPSAAGFLENLTQNQKLLGGAGLLFLFLRRRRR